MRSWKDRVVLCRCGSRRKPAVETFPELKGFRQAAATVECGKCLRSTGGKSLPEAVAMWNAAMSSAEVWNAGK